MTGYKAANTGSHGALQYFFLLCQFASLCFHGEAASMLKRNDRFSGRQPFSLFQPLSLPQVNGNLGIFLFGGRYKDLMLFCGRRDNH